jgi:hypothetical protein
LGEQEEQRLVNELMEARRAVKAAKASRYPGALATACQAVDNTKKALGERGPVWWTGLAPDFNRCLVKNTPCGGCFDEASLDVEGS